MKRLLSILAAAAVLPCSAQPASSPKVATVDMQELLKQHPLTKGEFEYMNQERAKVQKDNEERIVKLKEIEKELNTLRDEMQQPSQTDSKKQELFHKWQGRQQEGLALDRERTELFRRRNQAINEMMAQRIKKLMEEIRKVVEVQAKKDGYDHVLDRSALGSSMVPPLLYTKDSTDITASLIKLISESTPTSEGATPAPASAQ